MFFLAFYLTTFGISVAQEIICPADGVKHPSRYQCDGSTNACPPQWSCYENLACCISLTLLKKAAQGTPNNVDDRGTKIVKQHIDGSVSISQVSETLNLVTEYQSTLASTISTPSTEITPPIKLSLSSSTVAEPKSFLKENKSRQIPQQRKRIDPGKRNNLVSDQRPQIQDSIDDSIVIGNLGPPGDGNIPDTKPEQVLIPVDPFPTDLAGGGQLPPVDPTPPPNYFSESYTGIQTFPSTFPPNPTYGFISYPVTKQQLTQYGSKFSFENR